jgi:exopolysaccharide production protein ExoY
MLDRCAYDGANPVGQAAAWNSSLSESEAVAPDAADPPAASLQVFGILLAVVLIVFLAPVLMLVAALVACTSGPILYRHSRIGYQGRRFNCLKFRTMVVDGDRLLAELLLRDPEAASEWASTQKLRKDPRVTSIGRVLRKTSLDELPQLFNVVFGEMNLVGPRPIVEAEARKYGRQLRYYASVRPGITGLWQVSGRCETSYRRRIAYDRVYVTKRSLALDCSILIRTIPAVLGGGGAS